MVDTRMDLNDTLENDIAEIEANRFAAELLMPATDVRGLWVMSDKNIDACAGKFRCSRTAMKIRLLELGLIKVVETYEV